MATPKEFLEGFFRERTAAYAKSRTELAPVYARYFGDPLLKQASRYMPAETVREIIEDVKQSDRVAAAFVRLGEKDACVRMRYRLAADAESWKIIGIGRMCFLCHGTGEFNGSPCQKCNREGWSERT